GHGQLRSHDTFAAIRARNCQARASSLHRPRARLRICCVCMLWRGAMGENIGRAITAIYDAVLSDVHWPAALDAFAREIGSLGAVLVAVDKVGLPFTILQRSEE